MVFLMAVLVAFGVFLVFSGLSRMVAAPTRTDMLVKQYSAPLSAQEIELARPFSERVARPALRRLAGFAMRYTPRQVMDSTARKLDLAGNPLDLPPLEFLGVRAVSTVIGGLLFTLLFGLLRASGFVVPAFGLIGLVLGFYAPVLWLDTKIRERQQGIRVELPDALDLLAVCAEAGLGLDAGIAQIVNKWDNHISRAFARLAFELRVGRARETALHDMAARADVRELSDFIAAVVQAERFGSGVVQVLRVQSEQQRVLRRQRAQAQAAQLPVKLLFPLTFFIFPSTLIVLLGPAMIRLMEGFKV